MISIEIYDKLCHIRWVRHYRLYHLSTWMRQSKGFSAQRSVQRGDSFKTTSVSVFAISSKILAASRDIPRFLLFPSFLFSSGWNVNRGRDILQRGHGVRECGISLNLVLRDEIEKRKSGDRFQI